VLLELLDHQGDELPGQAVGFGVVAVAAEAAYRDHLEGGPAEGGVPLAAADRRAGEDAAGSLELREVGEDAAGLDG